MSVKINSLTLCFAFFVCLSAVFASSVQQSGKSYKLLGKFSPKSVIHNDGDDEVLVKRKFSKITPTEKNNLKHLEVEEKKVDNEEIKINKDGKKLIEAERELGDENERELGGYTSDTTEEESSASTADVTTPSTSDSTTTDPSTTDPTTTSQSQGSSTTEPITTDPTTTDPSTTESQGSSTTEAATTGSTETTEATTATDSPATTTPSTETTDTTTPSVTETTTTPSSTSETGSTTPETTTEKPTTPEPTTTYYIHFTYNITKANSTVMKDVIEDGDYYYENVEEDFKNFTRKITNITDDVNVDIEIYNDTYTVNHTKKSLRGLENSNDVWNYDFFVNVTITTKSYDEYVNINETLNEISEEDKIDDKKLVIIYSKIDRVELVNASITTISIGEITSGEVETTTTPTDDSQGGDDDDDDWKIVVGIVVPVVCIIIIILIVLCCLYCKKPKYTVDEKTGSKVMRQTNPYL